MAKVIVKIHHTKSEKGKGKFADYIANRDGVDKSVNQKMLLGKPTQKQMEYIKELLEICPGAKDSFEYEDYIENPTRQNASAFISVIEEEIPNTFEGKEQYLNYIATRPRVEKFGTHGLFGSEDDVKLSEVRRELNNHKGVMWTPIISLKREDAQRLGYDNAETWKELIRAKQVELAELFKIPLSEFKWYGAFHNEGHHPHAHMIVYSTDGKSGYLTEKNIEKIKSTLANEIFKNDMYELYDEKTQAREKIADEAKNKLRSIVETIQGQDYSESEISSMLLSLSCALSKVKGKKQYGYLPKPLKKAVEDIVKVMATEPDIQKLYDEWCGVQKKIVEIYKGSDVEFPPLWENKEFKKIRNAVVHEAVNLENDSVFFNHDNTELESDKIEPMPKYKLEVAEETELKEDDVENVEPPTSNYKVKSSKVECNYRGDYREARKLLYVDKDFETAFYILMREAKVNNAPACFDLGKMYANGWFVEKDEQQANKYFRKALNAYLMLENQKSNAFFEYQIGRLYSLDTDFQDYEKARKYFEMAAKDSNAYAMFSLGNLYYYGKGTEIDYETAFEWYKKSADKEMPYVYYRLGDMLRKGIGCKVDVKASDYYFAKVIPDDLSKLDKENYLNCYRIGKLFERGWGTKADAKKAVKCYEAACIAEYPQAEFALANMYYQGKGTKQDYKKALELYQKCVDDKMSHVNYKIGMMYKNGLGCEQDEAKAEHYFSVLINSNRDNITKENYLNCYYMGKLFEQGLGTEKDIAKAIECYETAGLADCAEADFALANLYYYGTETEQDYQKAFQLYLKCANKNIDYVYYRLGEMLYKGIGCEANEKMAEDYFAKFIKENKDKLTIDNHVNCYRMGKLYEKGVGTEIDIEKAIQCYKAACEAENSQAEFALAHIYFRQGETDMGKEYIIRAIEHGNEYVKEWYEKYQEYQEKIYRTTVKGAVGNLFCRLASIIATDTEKRIDGHNKTIVDSKERREILKKKQRLGLRLE